MKEKDSIVVYCASSDNIDESYKEAAYELGRRIASRNVNLVCGGGRSGLMAQVTEGALSNYGTVTGVLPQFMIARNWQHPHLTETLIVSDMHTRKKTMAGMSKAAIALPGGIGTFEELLEIITWRQLGLYDGNIVILNTNGYYDPLLRLLRSASEEGFMRKSGKILWRVAQTPEDALAEALFVKHIG